MTNKGYFQKGNDPRRHNLTTEERRRGFYAAMESIYRRHFWLLEGEGYKLARKFLMAKLKERLKD